MLRIEENLSDDYIKSTADGTHGISYIGKNGNPTITYFPEDFRYTYNYCMELNIPYERVREESKFDISGDFEDSYEIRYSQGLSCLNPKINY